MNILPFHLSKSVQGLKLSSFRKEACVSNPISLVCCPVSSSGTNFTDVSPKDACFSASLILIIFNKIFYFRDIILIGCKTNFFRSNEIQHPAPPTDWTNAVRTIILSLSILPNDKKEYDGAVGFTLCIVSIGLSLLIYNLFISVSRLEITITVTVLLYTVPYLIYLYALLIEEVRRRVYVRSLRFHSLVTFLILWLRAVTVL